MVPDRAVLFRYIHNLKDAEEVYAPIEQYAQPTSVNPVTEVLNDIILPVEEEPEETIIDSVVASEEVNIAEEEQTKTPEVLLQEEIQSEIPAKTSEEKQEEVIAETPEAKTTPAVESILEDIIGVVETEDRAEPAAEITNEIHSFTEWLKLQQGKKIVESKVSESKPVEGEVKEIVPAQTIQPESVKNEPEKQPEPVKPELEKSNINEFESILDKFIRENPRISRPKAEFYNPVNMAKQSVEDNDELVTETLANVYYKQGHYKKAIRAYEKLCLIYPHKMTYFASLIQKIKTENKD
jgi:hypothetical protein